MFFTQNIKEIIWVWIAFLVKDLFSTGSKLTAVELKTGKNKYDNRHYGQLMLYSLLTSERFENANKRNILLYIMDNVIKYSFYYIEENRININPLIRARNKLAKCLKNIN